MEVAEEWKAIPGTRELYEVSNMGRVRSLRSANGKGPGLRVLGGYLSPRGYHAVCISLDSKKRWIPIHRAMLMAWVGMPPPGLEAVHLNGNPSDNRLNNIAWATHRENCMQKIDHGTIAIGTRHGMAVINDEAVRAMRKLHGAGDTMRSIARRFGVSMCCVVGVVKRITWRHVPEES